MSVIKRSASVTCDDGLPIAVDVYHPEGASEPLPVCVLCHGFKGFKDWGMFPPLAERLAASGRAMVLFEFSHNGVGDQPGEFTRLDLFREQTLSRHVDDLGRVLDFLSSGSLAAECNLQTNDHFNVTGHSMGGAVGILRAADDGRIVQISTLNSVAHFERFGEEALAELESAGEVSIPNVRTGQVMPLGKAWFEDCADLDLEDAATQVFVPSLIVQAEADVNVLAAEAHELNGWIAGSRLALIPEADHTFGAKHPFAGWTPALESVARELDDFLPQLGRLGGI